jgi:hypothetical protein
MLNIIILSTIEDNDNKIFSFFILLTPVIPVVLDCIFLF